MKAYLIDRIRQARWPRMPFARTLSLSARLRFGFGLVLVLVVLVSTLSWLQTGRLLEKLQTVTREDFWRTELTFEMQECVDATPLSISRWHSLLIRKTSSSKRPTCFSCDNATKLQHAPWSRASAATHPRQS